MAHIDHISCRWSHDPVAKACPSKSAIPLLKAHLSPILVFLPRYGPRVPLKRTGCVRLARESKLRSERPQIVQDTRHTGGAVPPPQLRMSLACQLRRAL